jgi:hypothetical protein
VTALQSGRYVGYGYLHFSSVDGRDKNVQLVPVITEVLIKFSDQALVCSGGDGLEQPLQTPTLQFLNCPTCSFIVGELLFDGKGVLQQELTALNGWPSYSGMGPCRPGRRTSPSRHAGGFLGQVVEHLVCNPKSKGFRTPLKIT